MRFLQDIRVAVRSLSGAKGVAFTVILTLALGIGANSAIFTLVRGVLLRPLVNRDEDRLLYISQSARGLGYDDAAFSIPEIQDLEASVHTVSEFGDFSTIGFSMVGLGQPREVQAGVVDGSYFDVMGLRPVLGRLLDARDDGPRAAGAVVLTYRFWTNTLHSDPSVLGKTVRLDTRTATVVGVLEPSIPYPAETEIIANVVTSPHHLSATMVTGRVHRMTELFGRLAPGATLEAARAELRTAYGAMVRAHPEAYPSRGGFRIDAVRLRDQITARARPILLVLLAASVLVFVIACSNVANLILARTLRRENELAIRAALGASTHALRRVLLAESVLLCEAGAALGILTARPMVAVLARYAARFSVRAVDLTVDSSMLWVGGSLAIVAAVFLAFIPRLPSSGSQGYGLAGAGARVTGATTRRQRVFAVTQIAASFLLLAGASALLRTLLALQAAQTGLDVHHVLAINVPVVLYQRTPEQSINFYKETIRRVRSDCIFQLLLAMPSPSAPLCHGGMRASASHWRSPRIIGPAIRPKIHAPASVSSLPGFFAALGVPLIEGRDFNDADRRNADPVVIVSLSLAKRLFPGQDALNHHIFWTDPVIKFIDVSPVPRRIVGITPDIDDENVAPAPALTVYHPFDQQQLWGGRLFVHVHSDPYALVTPITRIIRGMSAEQPVEHAATLEDIRAEVLTPERLNTVVFGCFAAVALIIALVGVAGVLAFSVSGRTREFGIRMAVGSPPRLILMRVVAEGAAIAAAGVVAGAVCGLALLTIAGGYFHEIRSPGAAPVAGSAIVLLAAAIIASVLPAARAARVNVMQALRAE